HAGGALRPAGGLHLRGVGPRAVARAERARHRQEHGRVHRRRHRRDARARARVSALSIWAARALLPSGEAARVPGRCAAGRMAAVEEGVEPRSGDVRHENATLAPGLVDLQVNGGDGAAYDEPDAAARRRATAFHLRAGTTSLLATLVSAPLERLES